MFCSARPRPTASDGNSRPASVSDTAARLRRFSRRAPNASSNPLIAGDGGLRHAQPVSGVREAELFGDGYEIAQLASVKACADLIRPPD